MQTVSTEWKEIGLFIRSHRERAEPLVNMGPHGRSRQSRHLTQTELAELANVSTVLISKLEQGQYENINPRILKRIAVALELSEEEEQFMTGLLIPSPRKTDVNEAVPAWIEQSIVALNHPCAIVNPSFDILTWNSKLLGFMGDVSVIPPENRNVIFLMFCNSAMQEEVAGWEANARVMVASLKMIYSLAPLYRAKIRDLVSRVSDQSTTFAAMWMDTPPKLSTNMTKLFHHPTLGEMQVNEMVTQIVGTTFLFRIEFIPATESTRQKMELI